MVSERRNAENGNGQFTLFKRPLRVWTGPPGLPRLEGNNLKCEYSLSMFIWKFSFGSTIASLSSIRSCQCIYVELHAVGVMWVVLLHL